MRRLLIAALVLVAAPACSGSSGPDVTPVSASVSVAPAPNAVNVSRADTIRMWFDMPVDSGSCLTRFTLHMADSTGAAVPGHMHFGDGYRQMMFIPDSLLEPGARYFAHMRDSVMMLGSMDGSHMGTPMGGRRIMMFDRLPAGAMRMRDGMGWMFTTGS